MDPTNRTNTVDLNNLSSLTDKMHVLSALGGKLEDDWLGIHDLSSQLSNISVTNGALRKASISKVEELKVAMQTLNKLSAFIATETATLRTMISRHVLSSLPLEILSLIRVWLHVLDGHDNFTPVYPHQRPNMSFPLVCRRFREVELSTPELWTIVSRNMAIEQVKLRIARSGDLPLRVWVHPTPYPCQCDLWELLANHAQRCEWMYIDMRKLVWHSDIRNCFNTFDGVHFRKLRRLAIMFKDEATLPTLRTWSMPQLSELFCYGSTSLFALPISHPLDVLKLTFDSKRLKTNNLIDLLSSPAGSNLQTLGLELVRVNVIDTQSTLCAVLPTLKSFRLRLVSGRNIISLLQRLQAPSIEIIAIEIHVDRHEAADINYLIEWISSQRNPNLRNVDVQTFGFSWKRKDMDIIHSRIVDGISLHNDTKATLSTLPVVSVKTPYLSR